MRESVKLIKEKVFLKYASNKKLFIDQILYVTVGRILKEIMGLEM